jgi:hypothetical protein
MLLTLVPTHADRSMKRAARPLDFTISKVFAPMFRSSKPQDICSSAPSRYVATDSFTHVHLISITNSHYCFEPLIWIIDNK